MLTVPHFTSMNGKQFRNNDKVPNHFKRIKSLSYLGIFQFRPFQDLDWFLEWNRSTICDRTPNIASHIVSQVIYPESSLVITTHQDARFCTPTGYSINKRDILF